MSTQQQNLFRTALIAVFREGAQSALDFLTDHPAVSAELLPHDYRTELMERKERLVEQIVAGLDDDIEWREWVMDHPTLMALIEVCADHAVAAIPGVLLDLNNDRHVAALLSTMERLVGRRVALADASRSIAVIGADPGGAQ